MVVGESGLGKSTLINSLFLTDLYSPEYPGPSHRIKKTVQVEQSKVLIKEGGVQLLLTIVDTPGFGDAVDNSNCWQPVIDYIDSKFEDYLNAESRVNRRQMPDNRVQCCLYFVAPSGHGLKPLDIEFMKRLHEKVNIIPLIAKADTLTPEECQQFKKQIMKEIQEHKIKIYEFPETDDEEENKLVKKIKDRLPLAVVGSNTIIEVNGKRVRGRQYPWGVAEVENGEHCDFTILRNMLIRTHMQDLKDVTNNVHYENYRSRKLAAVTYNGVDNNKNKGQLTKSPLAQMEEERREHVAKMKKMEMEMEQVFEMKVKEKVQKLKDSEAELQRRHEQMKKNLEAQHKELEEKRRQFEEEKANWEAQQRILEQQNSSRDPSDLSHNRKFSAACNFSNILVNQERLNINTATEEELMTLPGVTRAVARSIVEYREYIGGFKKVEDLALVSGVGATKLEQVKFEICVSSKGSSAQHSPSSLRRDLLTEQQPHHLATTVPLTPRVNINTATPAQLMSVRGLTEKMALSIVDYRREHGPFRSIEDLVRMDGINAAFLDRIRHQVFAERSRPPSTHTNGGLTFTAKPHPSPTSLSLQSEDLDLPPGGPTQIISTRPSVEAFGGTRDGRPVLRLATWNLQGCSVEKANNPGVREVVCMTLLENRRRPQRSEPETGENASHQVVLAAGVCNGESWELSEEAFGGFRGVTGEMGKWVETKYHRGENWKHLPVFGIV
ncbi:Septin-7 [Sciurus carolinensis]|uniref:Septin-7 n=2 Tax=Sciuridae TaxID=55153 RepID=A0AA41NDQ3_SCICA|nr:Septin-7 [Sciurus carolinensis]